LSRPLIFISYSHKDEDWKDRILVHLGIAQKQELFDVWDDRRIEAGEDWVEAITNAIDAGCVGILLVSANSLTSNFILKEEATPDQKDGAVRRFVAATHARAG